MKTNAVFTALIAFLISCSASFAQSVKTHTVEAGETLTSVAKKYDVSEKDIMDANPKTKSYIFVGMELVIPEKKLEKTDGSSSQSEIITNQPTPTIENNVIMHSDDKVLKPKNGWGGAYNIGVGMSYLQTKENDNANKPFTMQIAFGARYTFSNSVFAEVMLGYNSKTYMSVVENDNISMKIKQEMDKHDIILPIHVGVKLGGSDGLFELFAGPSFWYNISGKVKTTTQSFYYRGGHKLWNSDSETVKSKLSKYDDYSQLHFTFDFGGRVNFDSFYIHATYQIEVNNFIKNTKENTLLFGIGYAY